MYEGITTRVIFDNTRWGHSRFSSNCRAELRVNFDPSTLVSDALIEHIQEVRMMIAFSHVVGDKHWEHTAFTRNNMEYGM